MSSLEGRFPACACSFAHAQFCLSRAYLVAPQALLHLCARMSHMATLMQAQVEMPQRQQGFCFDEV